MAKYTVGIDFGSLSGRTVVVDTATERELSCVSLAYPRAVMKNIYDRLYRECKTLHDYFGKGVNDVMQHLFDMAECERSRN